MMKAATVMLLLGALAVVPHAARADEPRETRVNLQLRDTAFRTAVERLFQGSGRQFTIEADVPNAPVTLNVQNADLDVAVRLVARLANVGARSEGATTVFFKKAEPQAFQPPVVEREPPLFTPPLRGEEALVLEKIPLRYASVDVLAPLLGGRVLPSEVDLFFGTRGTGGVFQSNSGYGSGFGGLGGYGSGYGGPYGQGYGDSGYGYGQQYPYDYRNDVGGGYRYGYGSDEGPRPRGRTRGRTPNRR